MEMSGKMSSSETTETRNHYDPSQRDIRETAGMNEVFEKKKNLFANNIFLLKT